MSLNFEPNTSNWIHFVKDEIDILRAFAIGIEKTIEESKEKFSSSVQEEVINVDTPGETTVNYLDGLDDMTYHLPTIFLQHFPNIHRRSALITFYSFLEDSLYSLCSRFKNELDPKISLNDLKGDGVKKYKTYLEKVVGLDLTEFNSVWGKITNIQKIRNVIVHEGGYVKEDNEAVMNCIKYTPNVLLISQSIVLENEFLQYVLDILKKYFECVDKAIISFSE